MQEGRALAAAAGARRSAAVARDFRFVAAALARIALIFWRNASRLISHIWSHRVRGKFRVRSRARVVQFTAERARARRCDGGGGSDGGGGGGVATCNSPAAATVAARCTYT